MHSHSTQQLQLFICGGVQQTFKILRFSNFLFVSRTSQIYVSVCILIKSWFAVQEYRPREWTLVSSIYLLLPIYNKYWDTQKNPAYTLAATWLVKVTLLKSSGYNDLQQRQQLFEQMSDDETTPAHFMVWTRTKSWLLPLQSDPTKTDNSQWKWIILNKRIFSEDDAQFDSQCCQKKSSTTKLFCKIVRIF